MKEVLNLSRFSKWGKSDLDEMKKIAVESPFQWLVYMTRGNAVYQSGETPKKMREGMLYLLPLNRRYLLFQEDEEEVTCMWFLIALEDILMENVLEFDPAKQPSLSLMLQTLQAVDAEGVDVFTMKKLVTALVVLLRRQGGFQTVGDRRVERVLSYINESYQDPYLDNFRLAELIGINSRYFIRLFKKNLNQTPYEYISNYRIYQSVNLLLQGWSIQEISERVGFLDPKSYTRFFKNKIGCSPTEYRRDYLEIPQQTRVRLEKKK